MLILDLIVATLAATWQMLLLSSPWLLIGCLIAGVLHVFLPPQFVQRHLAKPGTGSVFRSALIGIPLPLCSCSVIPVAVSLRRAGASRGATASFFVSTPEVGADSFLLSYGLLGPVVAVARVIGAFLSAIGVGVIVDRLGDEVQEAANESSTSSCCAHEHNHFDSEPEVTEEKDSLLRQVLSYGFGSVIDDLAFALSIGLLVAGMAAALIPDNYFSDLGLSSYATMFLMLLVSVPVYVCASSLTPFAAALLTKGVSAGAVLVLLLAGPATNLATMLAVRQELGGKALAVYLGGIAVGALIVAWVVDTFFAAAVSAMVPAEALHQHSDHSSLEVIAALVMMALLSRSLWKQLRKKNVKECHSKS